VQEKEIEVIYEDENLLVVDKPPGLPVISRNRAERTLGDLLAEKYPEIKRVGKPPRYGIIHRLDRDTSGIILVAKNKEALIFFQKQFRDKKVIKKYFALVVGSLKQKEGEIRTLIGRNPKNRLKQKVYLPGEPKTEGKRLAVTYYKAIKKFRDYTLVEVIPETGRKHQIRCHFLYLGNPIAGDKLYRFKNQPCPEGLNRQFLHAYYVKLQMPNGKEKEFKSDLPKELKVVLSKLIPQKEL